MLPSRSKLQAMAFVSSVMKGYDARMSHNFVIKGEKERQHNYSNKRTLAISTTSREAHVQHMAGNIT
jgi:hypothetical protein